MRDRWRIFIHENASHRNGAAYDGGSYSWELSRSVVLPTHCQRLCDISLVIKTMPSNHLYGPRDWPCQGWPFFLEGNANQPYYKCIAPVTCILMAAAFWWLRHGNFATRCQPYSRMFQDIRHSYQRTDFTRKTLHKDWSTSLWGWLWTNLGAWGTTLTLIKNGTMSPHTKLSPISTVDSDDHPLLVANSRRLGRYADLQRITRPS